MKKFFIILTAAALTAGLLFVSCSKDDGGKKNNNTQELEEPEADPNSPIIVSRYVRNSDGDCISTPVGKEWEWDGNDYYITIYNKETGSFVTGPESYFSVTNEKGDDIFQAPVIQSLTSKQYLVAKLTPKALGACILKVLYSDGLNYSYSLRIKVTVTRKQPYYLGMVGTSALIQDRYALNQPVKLAWKVNNNGKVSENHPCTVDDISCTAHADYLKVDKLLSSDGTYAYYQVSKKDASASFQNASAYFSLRTSDGATHTKYMIFTTYGFSAYELYNDAVSHN